LGQRQLVVRLRLVGRQRLERLGVEFGEALALLLGSEPVDPLDDRRGDPGHRVAVLAELGVVAHQRAHDRADLCLPSVLERVHQRRHLGGALDALPEFGVHTSVPASPT